MNIVCVHPHCGPRNPNCKELPPDAEFRQAMLDIHNELRNKVASGEEKRNGISSAANMRALSYDLRLEYTAQCQVNGCNMNHDICSRTQQFRSTGQNLLSSFSVLDGGAIFTPEHQDELLDGKSFALSVNNNWYEAEIAFGNFTDDINSYRPNIKTDYFTSLIWAQVTHLGCARAMQEHNESAFMRYLTCNYGPAPNSVQQKIFEKGRPCSKCPSNMQCNNRYKALCGEIDESVINTGLNPFHRAYEIPVNGNSSNFKISLGNFIIVIFIIIHYPNFF